MTSLGPIAPSVIIPAYDVADYLAGAVESVRRQTRPVRELIVVDDGSSDATVKVARACAETWAKEGRVLRVITQTNAGAAAARNRGLELAESAWVAFLDADDRWHPTLLEELASTLEGAPSAQLVFPQVRYVDEQDRPLGIESRRGRARVGLKELLLDNPIHTASGVLVRTEALRKIGGFDPEQRACNDLEAWVRLATWTDDPIAASAAVAVDYRRRGGQITSDWSRMRTYWLRMIDLAEGRRPEEVGPLRAEAYGRQHLYWSTLAYANGDFRAARRLVARAWWHAGRSLAAHPHLWVRSVACVASLLPTRVHEGIRDRFNQIRRTLRWDLSRAAPP